MTQNYFVVFYNLEWHVIIVDENNQKQYKPNHDILNIKEQDLIICFQTSDLIREYKNKKVSGSIRLPQIIDLESLDMQMSQKGRDIRFLGKWSIWHRLLESGIISSFYEIGDDVFLFLEHIKTFYEQLIKDKPEELSRLDNIEKEVNKIIHKAQIRGIRIDKQDVQKKCCELENRIYKIKNKFQLEYKIFTPDAKKTQINWLIQEGYRVYDSIEDTFKANKNNNICYDFYELIRSMKDYNCYLYMLSHWGGLERVYPSYIGFGTITSRITMRQPSIQNLRKQNRDIIKADEGKKLIYVDYSQFEAGILASLSEDSKLLSLYEKDIYEDLAQYINKERADAKIIFYRYMYGDNSLNQKIKGYFMKFEQLQSYQTAVRREIEKEDKIGSSQGNYRIIGDDKEASWALSHKIQSTASLIFKNALIKVNRCLQDADLLVPLHDAALYQVPNDRYQEYAYTLPQIFEEEFKAICPNIKAKALISEFAISNESCR